MNQTSSSSDRLKRIITSRGNIINLGNGPCLRPQVSINFFHFLIVKFSGVKKVSIESLLHFLILILPVDRLACCSQTFHTDCNSLSGLGEAKYLKISMLKSNVLITLYPDSKVRLYQDIHTSKILGVPKLVRSSTL